MSYDVRRRWGDYDDDASVEQMREALAELDAEDDEHPSVSLVDDSGRYLDAYPGGLLIWDDLSAAEYAPRHMRDVSRERVLELWQKLAAGDISAVESEAWKPGHG